MCGFILFFMACGQGFLTVAASEKDKKTRFWNSASDRAFLFVWRTRYRSLLHPCRAADLFRALRTKITRFDGYLSLEGQIIDCIHHRIRYDDILILSAANQQRCIDNLINHSGCSIRCIYDCLKSVFFKHFLSTAGSL